MSPSLLTVLHCRPKVLGEVYPHPYCPTTCCTNTGQNFIIIPQVNTMDTDDDQRQQQQQQQDTTADEEGSDADGVAADGGDGGEDVEDDDQGQSPSAGSDSVLVINAVTNLDSLYGLREIGRDALCWQLSSAKPGNGVEQIRDANTDTCTYEML